MGLLCKAYVEKRLSVAVRPHLLNGLVRGWRSLFTFSRRIVDSGTNRVDQRGILRKISSHGDSRMVGFAGR